MTGGREGERRLLTEILTRIDRRAPHIAASSQEATVDLHLQAAEISLDLLRAAGRLPA